MNLLADIKLFERSSPNQFETENYLFFTNVSIWRQYFKHQNLHFKQTFFEKLYVSYKFYHVFYL